MESNPAKASGNRVVPMFAGFAAIAFSWLKSKWLYVAGAIAIIAAVLAAIGGIKNAGRNAEKIEQMRRIEDARREKLVIENRVRDLPPDERDRMLDRYYRD